MKMWMAAVGLFVVIVLFALIVQDYNANAAIDKIDFSWFR